MIGSGERRATPIDRRNKRREYGGRELRKGSDYENDYNGKDADK